MIASKNIQVILTAI